MQYKIVTVVFYLIFCISCTGRTTSNNPKNIATNPNFITNSNVNSNGIGNFSYSNNNNQITDNAEVSPEMLRQIEAQQKESQRLAEEQMKSGGTKTEVNSNTQNIAPKNQPPKTNIPPAQRRTS